MPHVSLRERRPRLNKSELSLMALESSAYHAPSERSRWCDLETYPVEELNQELVIFLFHLRGEAIVVLL
jgi:hypothetical protein